MLFSQAATSPWDFRAHIEVWMVVSAVVILGVYVARVIAPKVPASARGEGPAITAAQKRWFAFGVLMLWLSSDWPLHDLAEQYSYALHMVQHFLLTLVVPPIFWLATPAWLGRLVIPPTGAAWRWLRRLAHPVTAAVIFNVVTIATHWTLVVNTSVEVAPVHYLVHLIAVASAALMWIPVCGPWRELRLSPGGTCVYLFVQSIVPTVPGAWLTLAEHPVYEVYEQARQWGVDVVLDQQYAGLFMKVGGGFYLWGLIVFVFFRWALSQERDHRHYNLVRIEDALPTTPTAPTSGEQPAPTPS